MAGTDSKIGIWTETTVEGQPYWHSTGIEDRLPTTEAPEAPSGLAVTPGSTTAALTWDAVTGADSIALYRRDDTAMGSFALVTDEIAGNATSYNDTGLTPENEYSWYITATNEAGTSDPSSTVTDTTLAAGELTLTGTIAHGNTLTLTGSGMGTRTNVKPLYVNLGTSKTSSNLGRLEDDYYSSIASVQTDQPNGSFSSAIRFDIQASFTNRLYEGIEFDPDKPMIMYLERYYQRDITDPTYQSAGDYNLKTNRFFGGDTTPSAGNEQNFYIGYQGNQGANSARVGVEHIDQGDFSGSKAYTAGVPAGQWLSEEIIFINSSSQGATDGRLYHYRNNTLLNSDAQDHTLVTHTAERPVKVYYDWGDQWSNSGSAVGPQYIWAGLHIRDDEWNGVYVGNAATLAACTKLVRLPQTSWSDTSVQFVYYETRVADEDAYFYVRTGYDTWVSTTGVR